MRATLPVQTEPMELEWRQRLRLQAARAVVQQPRLFKLWRRLLDLGGDGVAFAVRERYLEEILARGQVFKSSARVKRGAVSQCHQNVAGLWSKRPRAMQIATGYALSADGCWRKHSWLIDLRKSKPPLIETTEDRVLYFGVVLTAEEAVAFCQYYAD
jgi:hypothetical protein